MRSLITGITGFVGSHLAENLLAKKEEVFGIYRWRSPFENINEFQKDLKLYECDLKDLSSTIRVIKEVSPQYIYHLAAQSFVPPSFTQPKETLETNTIGTLNLLEAVRIIGIKPFIHVCSSADVYGDVKRTEAPIKEDNPIRPVSPYAVSKASAELFARQYYMTYGIKSIITRAFNITGPRRGEVFAESSFAKQIAEIEAGKRSPIISVGNLDSIRTYADVRDIAEAYCLAVHKGQPGETYNIAGNTTIAIGKILDLLISLSDAKSKIKVKTQKSLLRPTDSTSKIPDSSKFKQTTKWKPKINIEKSLADLLEYWRMKI